ncbi:MAG: hypothetical protein Q9Q13_14445 [Acidobacteriota bacterium]|nr:hypothetical protein [Acidobacteriota bacterium]
MMRYCVPLLLALMGLGAATAQHGEPRLRVRVRPFEKVPAYQEVRLGQVADLQGPSAESVADLSLGRAPGPGRRRVVSRAAISRMLGAAGLDGEAVVVEGAAQLRLMGIGQRLDVERARQVLEQALRASLPGGRSGSSRPPGPGVPATASG